MKQKFKRLRACFFALVPNPTFFDFVEFYATDIRILRELGFEVHLASKPWHIPFGCDLYFSWFHGPALAAQMVATLSGKPHVVVDNPHAALPKEIAPKTNPKELIWQLFERINMRLSHCTLATSEHELRIYKALKACNPRLIYHGVDTEFYSSNGKVRRPYQVLTVTHLRFGNIARKRVKEIIQAIPLVSTKFPYVEFVIVGGWNNPSIIQELQQLAEKIGALPHVRFTGEISQENKLRLYRESAVYLQPTMYEGFGLAIAEAMSCELPVVTSRVGAVPEVVGNNALFARGDDPADIAAEVCKLLGDPGMRKHMGEQGRKRIVHLFSYETRRDKIAGLLNNIL